MLLKYGTGSNLTVVNDAPNGYKPKVNATNETLPPPTNKSDKQRKPQGRSKNRVTEQEDESEESESEEELFDPYVLSKLKFQQSSEKKSWQGVNVLHSGIPGTSSLIPNEGIRMFAEERQEIEAQDKVFEIFADIYELSLGMGNTLSIPQNPQAGSETPSKGSAAPKSSNSKSITKYMQHYDSHNANHQR